ncbi:MAG TPA: formylglycine-generating enzyme family protein [Polyangiaceae bacterium]|nr:formylglycine-generating enzyme family protein [Polyangiaceae bacterium]
MIPWRIALLGVLLAAPALGERAPRGMARVGPGVYEPLYPASPTERTVKVPAFYMDVTPVTNQAFLAFVHERPEWRRDRVKPLFADFGYLAHWEDAERLGASVRPAAPVTNVSWFSAKAYCKARGAELPTERQWELAAAASDSSARGADDPAWTERVLAWYAEPTSARPLADVGGSKPNFWGIRDLHGLVWEWVYDFGASLVTMDSREKGVVDQTRFCGGAGADAQNPSDYAAFMRIAFRSSLEARYTTSRLGFRCVKEIERKP